MTENLKNLVEKIDKLKRQLSYLPSLEERNQLHEIEEYQHLVLELEESLIIFKYELESSLTSVEEIIEKPVEEEPIAEGDNQKDKEEENAVSRAELIDPEMHPANKILSNLDEAIESLEREEESNQIELTEKEFVEEPIMTDAVFEEEEEDTISQTESIEEREEVTEDIHEINDHTSPKSSVSDRLSRMPIKDLKSAFGLNERFYYANELFGGNGEEFIRAINEFNHLSSFEDAQKLMEAKYIQLYNWDLEKEEVSSFIDLLERRYL